ncbi:MAG: LysM peptidoglycan-binding domain-containing M23 family metallopeptidase [bacterium]|nr:LysM peptidoglycan-binding domain-containing M23 family metallopeptidase [bacterium]
MLKGILTVIVPVYRLIYRFKKRLDRFLGPAKNRLMALTANRFAIHVVVGVLVAFVVILNVQTEGVRAETFGDKSHLYALVASEGLSVIEEVAVRENFVPSVPIQYAPQTSLTAMAQGIDLPVFSFEEFSRGTLIAPGNAISQDIRTNIFTYVVAEGDTTSTIAERFSISLNTLLWANDLTVRSTIKPGLELVILPTSGVQHEVARGDTVGSLAKKYDVEEVEIVRYNALASAEDIVVGESLIIPGGTVSAPAPVSRPASVSNVFTPAPVTSAPQVSAARGMVWPTDLRLITQYYGWTHTGIDIDCHFTNDNYAADDGVVQFAGWKGGYGYTVEINHGNGMTTRYGHHASMYVTAGQSVSKGQAIGRCGTTGRSTGTHLHFEVVVGGRFQNPLEYVR